MTRHRPADERRPDAAPTPPHRAHHLRVAGEPPQIDRVAAEQAVQALLTALGQDPESEHLRETGPRHPVPLFGRAPPAPVPRCRPHRLPAIRTHRRPVEARPPGRTIRSQLAGAGTADQADRRLPPVPPNRAKTPRSGRSSSPSSGTTVGDDGQQVLISGAGRASLHAQQCAIECAARTGRCLPLEARDLRKAQMRTEAPTGKVATQSA